MAKAEDTVRCLGVTFSPSELHNLDSDLYSRDSAVGLTHMMQKAALARSGFDRAREAEE